jgi:hypothetical protein
MNSSQFGDDIPGIAFFDTAPRHDTVLRTGFAWFVCHPLAPIRPTPTVRLVEFTDREGHAMQTWAGRGFQAVPVNGGTLAAGTESTSNVDGCSGWWGAEAGAGLGEFTDNPPWSREVKRHETRIPASRLDWEWDAFAAADREAAGRHRLTPSPSRLELAGWVVDLFSPGLPWPAEHPWEIGSPAEGFHRSLCWTGAVRDLWRGDEQLVTTGRALVVPSEDPAVIMGFDQAAKAEPGEPAPLLTFRSADLTVGGLPDSVSELHIVPADLVAEMLSTMTRPEPAPQEFVPLAIPGEYQEQAHEVPKLSDLAGLHWPAAPRSPRDDLDQTMPGIPGYPFTSNMTMVVEPIPDPLSATVPLAALTHV